MKYLFYPIGVIFITLFVIVLIIVFSLIWFLKFIWDFKKPDYQWNEFFEDGFVFSIEEDNPVETWKWLMGIYKD
jgi:hypothetical protein